MSVPLHDAFNKMMSRLRSGPPDPGFRQALLEAFMAGAAAYDRLLTAAVDTGKAQIVARIQDEMAAEIRLSLHPRGRGDA